ncbi:MAG: CinA family protein, partial [Actinomycetota bacterium]|nr:CinA family protein [Actinomycetota bacterium]
QALVPVGARTIPQQPGTAPGLMAPIPQPDGSEKIIYAVPGVPYEIKEMVSGTVIPDLQERAGVRAVIDSRVLRTWGQSESGLAEMLADRIDHLDSAGNPTLAFLASGVEGIKVRITAKADSHTDVFDMLDAEESVLRGILGDLIFALDDHNMEAAVLGMLAERGQTLGVIETVSSGYMSNRLATAVHGAEAFAGGVVARGDAVTAHFLGENPPPLASAEAAAHLARVARGALVADVGIATTAVETAADATDEHPFGTAWVAVSMDGFETVETVGLPGDLERVRQFSVISVLNLLRLHLEGRR